MRGIFIYYKQINYASLTGIDKKVLGQVEVFNDSGIDCKLITMDKNKKKRLSTLIDQIIVCLPYGNRYPKWKFIEEFKDIDYIYFRRPTCFSNHMVRVFRKIKKCNPNIKIILEIPTYPYDNELRVKLRYFPLLIKDRYNRSKLSKFINRIAIQNDIDKLFDISTIKFINGIKVDDIPIRKPIENNGEIIMCAVASLNAWQGYERVIKGLENYYKDGGKQKIIFHIVGDGSERKYYEQLVKECKLENEVKIHGSLFGEELNYIYNISDIAFDAFGRYKTNNDISTSLKSREYLAKGLPIVSGCKIDIVNDDNLYHLQFPNNELPLNFNEIINFYQNLYISESKTQVANSIRQYAYKVCDVSNTMREVIQYIKS